MVFAIIVTCKEVKGESGGTLIHDGAKVVVINESEGWVSHTCRSLWAGETIPKDAKTFPTREKAEAFARYLDSDEAKNDTSWWKTWHPWYVQPKSWEVVELKPVTRTEVVGFKIADGVLACWACNGTGMVTTSSNGSGLIETPCTNCASGGQGTQATKQENDDGR